MSSLWSSLLMADPEVIIAPWVGSSVLYFQGRVGKLTKKPPEYGWHRFHVGGGRSVAWLDQVEPDYGLLESYPSNTGYLIGNRFIDGSDRVRSFSVLAPVHLVEPGLPRFSRVRVYEWEAAQTIFGGIEFDEGPEEEVRAAFQEGRSIDSIKGVTPALESAFILESRYQQLQARRAAEAEEQRQAAERQQSLHTAEGRRALAQQDYRASAAAALSMSNAQLLECRGTGNGEYVLTFRYRERRWECVADMQLRIVDSGICLTDEATGYHWDSHLTLESLPDVIGEAIDTGQLVIYRHA